MMSSKLDSQGNRGIPLPASGLQCPRSIGPVSLSEAAECWGGNPDKEAVYLNVVPEKNDGRTVHGLKVPASVPVDAFWSVSLYNKDGFFEKNELGAYSLNSITAKKGADGVVDIQFGGCDGVLPNCLPIMEGWNYMVRLYRPRAEVLNGTWTFPAAAAK